MIYLEKLKQKVSQQEQTLIGRKLLLRGLQMEYGLSEIPEISFGIYGKPYFKTLGEIHFNISHCDRGVVCIVSDNNVGIDIECINPFDEELAEYVANQEELKVILNHPNPALAFTILWTKKESLCKLTGKGIDTRKEIQEILSLNPVKFQTIINEAGGYVITSCSI